jgi:hypothetical protein
MNLEQRLRMSLAICEPGPQPLAAVMAQLSAAGPRAPGGRRRGRIIIVSAVLALAAAAGMLAAHLTSIPEPISTALPVTAAAVAAVPAEPALAGRTDGAVTPAPATNAVVQAPTAMPAPAEPMQPAAASFTVLVQPLQFETEAAAARSRAQQYFDALLDELRAVPDLVLLGPDGGNGAAQAEFRITVTADDTRDMEKLAGKAMWQVSLRTEVWRGGAYRQEFQGSGGAGGTLDPPSCPQGMGQPVKCGPAADAARAVTSLLKVFPATPALAALLRARNDEAVQARTASGEKRVVINIDPLRTGATAVMDARVMQTILERIAQVPAPEARAVLWSSLRGQKQPELLPQLLKALREETAEAVRREVMTQLALDFPDDSATRAALTTAAADEPGTLTGQIARRALSGDESWRAYVATTVRDTSLSTAQRLDPLNWMIGAAQLDPRMDATFKTVLPALLDGDGVAVLADLLTVGQKQSAAMLGGLGGMTLLVRLGVMDHPAVADLLVACFDAMPSEITLRVLAQRRGDPRVRNKLEAIAAGDADPKLRQVAASFVQQAAPALQVAPNGN